MSAWAVDDISLSVVKDGISPNWAASVSDENVVTLNRGGATEWGLLPAISTANYTGVEVVFSTAPTIAEGQTLSMSVYYEGEESAVTTNYESGTTLSATFAEDKKVTKVALTTGWSESESAHATFTLSSLKIKGKSGTGVRATDNVALAYDMITPSWAKVENTQNIKLSQYGAAGWEFNTPVSTDEYKGISLTLTEVPTTGGAVVVKYADNSEQRIDVTSTTVSADFSGSGMVNSIMFQGDGWHENDADKLGDFVYGIGTCTMLVKSATQYDVTIDSSISNGAVVAGNAKYAEGSTVTLTVTPADGYKLSKLIIEVVADAGESNGTQNARRAVPAVGDFITATKQEDGTWAFTMPSHAVLVSATFTEKTADPTVSYNKPIRTITIINTEYSIGSTLHYTLNDGTEQTTTDETVTQVITENTAVKAWIVATDNQASNNVEQTFNVAAKPTVTYTAGENKVNLSLTAATDNNTADSKLYYTTDGTTPTTSSTELTADTDIDITEGMTTVKVLALDADGNYSEIAEQAVDYAYYLTTSKEWTTFYSPKTFTVPTGLKAYIVTSVTQPEEGESGTVNVEEKTIIAKNTPMLIQNENASTTAKFRVTPTEDQEISGTASEFKGVASATELSNDGTLRYVLVDGVFLRTLGGTIPAYNCYLEFGTSSPAPARRFSIAIGGNTTGIESIGTASLNDGQWYDLQGRRVSQPRKGIFMKNGKKVVVK